MLGCALGLPGEEEGHRLPGTAGDLKTPAAAPWAGFYLKPEGLFGAFYHRIWHYTVRPFHFNIQWEVHTHWGPGRVLAAGGPQPLWRQGPVLP